MLLPQRLDVLKPQTLDSSPSLYNPSMTFAPTVSPEQRARHLEWLLAVTAIPTAAGHEDGVIRWVEHWVAERPTLRLKRDAAGNVIITPAPAAASKRHRAASHPRPDPVFITAHLDHPAFIVTGVEPGGALGLEFRGGVHDPYFVGAAIEVIDRSDRAHAAVITDLNAAAQPFKRVTATLRSPAMASGLAPGDIARWKFPRPVVREGLLYTHACDDLAAVAAALAVLDVTHRTSGLEHVGVLLTRAEEIGFVGAIAACKLGTVPKKSRLICLENSRSFAESPIGAGPILRVGDRMSVFEPSLTNRLTDILLEHAKSHPDFKWQRKLMPGGTCEATTFSSYGYRSTCVCLPLGNYHNMRDIDRVQSGKRPARVGQEFIAVSDFHGLVDLLLIGCAQLDRAAIKPLRARMDDLLAKHHAIVGLPVPGKDGAIRPSRATTRR